MGTYLYEVSGRNLTGQPRRNKGANNAEKRMI